MLNNVSKTLLTPTLSSHCHWMISHIFSPLSTLCMWNCHCWHPGWVARMTTHLSSIFYFRVRAEMLKSELGKGPQWNEISTKKLEDIFLSVDYHIFISERLFMWTCFPRENSSSHSFTFIIREEWSKTRWEEEEEEEEEEEDRLTCFNKNNSSAHEKKKENWSSHTHSHTPTGSHAFTHCREKFQCVCVCVCVWGVYFNFSSSLQHKNKAVSSCTHLLWLIVPFRFSLCASFTAVQVLIPH